MIEESATVVSVDGGFAVLETERRSACASCQVNKGCGTGVLSRVLGKRMTHVRAINTAGAGAGDQVVVGLQESALVQGSLAVYLMPLLAMVGAAIFAEFMSFRLGMQNSEIPAIVAGIFGLAGGLIWLRRYSQRISHDSRYQPVVLRVEQRGGAGPVSGLQPSS